MVAHSMNLQESPPETLADVEAAFVGQDPFYIYEFAHSLFQAGRSSRM